MEDFVPYKIILKLEEKGYKGKTIRYHGHIYDVLKWLREEKRWVIVVRLYSTNGWYWFIQDEKGELKSSYLASCDDCFSSYEQAALAGIEYVLDNLI